VWSPLPQSAPAGGSPFLPAPRTGPSQAKSVEAQEEERVERLVAGHRFAEAERAVERIPRPKDRAWTRLSYVKALLTWAEIARARRQLEICLTEEPLLLEAHLLKASFAEEVGDLNAAEQAYRRALYIDRNCPMAHFHLALVQQEKGDLAGAERSLNTTQKLIEHRDPYQLAEFGEGICYARLGEMVTLLLANLRPSGASPEINH
jgi:tetratricopeptide (TPR) repeat protein